MYAFIFFWGLELQYKEIHWCNTQQTVQSTTRAVSQMEAQHLVLWGSKTKETLRVNSP